MQKYKIGDKVMHDNKHAILTDIKNVVPGVVYSNHEIQYTNDTKRYWVHPSTLSHITE